VTHVIFQNEKKKDKELTSRIEKILMRRDEVVKGADLSTLSSSCFLGHLLTITTDKIEASVDHIVNDCTPTILALTPLLAEPARSRKGLDANNRAC
jgi:hypothetical protein